MYSALMMYFSSFILLNKKQKTKKKLHETYCIDIGGCPEFLWERTCQALLKAITNFYPSSVE